MGKNATAAIVRLTHDVSTGERGSSLSTFAIASTASPSHSILASLLGPRSQLGRILAEFVPLFLRRFFFFLAGPTAIVLHQFLLGGLQHPRDNELSPETDAAGDPTLLPNGTTSKAGQEIETDLTARCRQPPRRHLDPRKYHRTRRRTCCQ